MASSMECSFIRKKARLLVCNCSATSPAAYGSMFGTDRDFMLSKRIIPCLDVDRGRVVKGMRFVSIVDAGDPVEHARAYDAQGADELTFLDITASSDKRDIIIDLIRRVADEVFI